MAKKSSETCIDVIFRVFPEGDVIALFPGEVTRAGHINSYQHVGQHGEASRALIHELRTATPKEYKSLLAELKQIGYCVRVRSTATAHATMSATGKPSKEQFQQAAKWIRGQLNKRDDGGHPSHLAAKVLEEADTKFGLGSYGVEGWAKSPSIGYQYLNYGDSYDPTIVVRSNASKATVIVAMGGWASYA
jgi:hypothetical protein